jgi:hypothetical protein
LISLPDLKDDRDLIPYICFYDGLALLKNSDETVMADDLVKGYQKKKQFLKKPIENCEANLKSDFEKPSYDSLMPFQDKYQDNKYLDIYAHFCKKEKKGMNLSQMYTTGLELQLKLDKIMDYDQCSEETANAMGL